MSVDITFKGVTKKEKQLWNGGIKRALASLPRRELRVVPDIYVYPTLTKSLRDNFDTTTPMYADLKDRYKKKMVWAHARIVNYDNENKFISFAIREATRKREPIVPEVSIFHEIGHFQYADRKKIVMTAWNRTEIELACDWYGLYAYVRMLINDKEYKTISNEPAQLEFEANVRKLIQMELPGRETPAAIRGGIAKVVNTIMRKMKWTDLYENNDDHEQNQTAAKNNN